MTFATLAGAAQQQTAAPTYSEEVLTDGPIGYWRLGESSGTTAADESSNGLTATWSGTYTLGVAGALAGDTDLAANLGGGQAQAAYNAVLNVTAAITVEAWIKTTQTGLGTIVGRDDNTTGDRVFQFRHNNGAMEVIAWVPSLTSFFDLSVSVNDDSWHHVVWTFDAGDHVLYVDGVSVATHTAGTVLDTTGVVGIGIGERQGGTAARYTGDVDEVAIYGTALSAARVLAHYNAGVGA